MRNSRSASSFVAHDHGAERERSRLAQVPEPRVPEPPRRQCEQERERPRGTHPGSREIGLQPERQEHDDGDRGRDGQDDPAELLGGREAVRLVQMGAGEDRPRDERGAERAASRSPSSVRRPRSGSSTRTAARARSRTRRSRRPSGTAGDRRRGPTAPRPKPVVARPRRRGRPICAAAPSPTRSSPRPNGTQTRKLPRTVRIGHPAEGSSCPGGRPSDLSRGRDARQGITGQRNSGRSGSRRAR